MNIPIIGLLGIVNLVLVVFQVLSGLKIIKVSLSIHKTGAFILLGTASIHGLLAFFAH